MLELLKLLVQPVCIERDENGVVSGERIMDAQAVYSQEHMNQLIDEVKKAVREENDKLNGGSHAGDRNVGVEDSLRQPSVPR